MNSNNENSKNDSKLNFPCAGVILIKNGTTILVTSPQGHYSFPKGKKEKDESDLDAALREVTEETGILPHQFKLIENFHVDEFSDKGFPSVRYFVGILDDGIDQFTLDPEELVAVGFYSYEQLFALEKLKPSRKVVFQTVLDNYLNF